MAYLARLRWSDEGNSVQHQHWLEFEFVLCPLGHCTFCRTFCQTFCAEPSISADGLAKCPAAQPADVVLTNTMLYSVENTNSTGVPVHLLYSVQYITARPFTKATCNCSNLMFSKILGH
jgi:hypothetical protein